MLLLAHITFLKSTSAALEWGNYIKASFDVFLPELYNKLGFNSALTRDEERENWTRFSQAIIYRHKKYIHNRSSSGEQENRGS
ncbi:hypothetical protein CAL7716_101200 (plasmid) [Calothrix sp. PCC 7716]|nr:hypothetical protein CAL7716_101200 [Calothrix sp. PCC 7716]